MRNIMKEIKKNIVFVLTLALCAIPLNVPLVFAETVTEPTAVVETPSTTETDIPPVQDANGEAVSPGTLPDSPFYWLTMLIEKLQVALTFDPVEKTGLLEDQALERLAEAEALIEKGNAEQAEVTLQAYTEKVTEAQAFLAELTDTNSETIVELETALSQTHAKNIETLGGLLDKLPPQAAQKVALNVVRSMEKSIAKMDKEEQKKLSKELKKATEDLKESELDEEDQEDLESFEEIMDLLEDESEEIVEATAELEQTPQTLTAKSLIMDSRMINTVTETEKNKMGKDKTETLENIVTESKTKGDVHSEQKLEEQRQEEQELEKQKLEEQKQEEQEQKERELEKQEEAKTELDQSAHKQNQNKETQQKEQKEQEREED